MHEAHSELTPSHRRGRPINTLGGHWIESNFRLADRCLDAIAEACEPAVPEGLSNATSSGVGVSDRDQLAVEGGLFSYRDEQVEQVAIVKSDVPPAHTATRERTTRRVSGLLGDHRQPGVQGAGRVSPLH